MKKIVVWLNVWRLIIPTLLFLGDKELRDICISDIRKINYALPKASNYFQFIYALIFNIPYRGVYYYRIRNKKVLRAIHSIFIPNKREIEISGLIGPGLAIFHGQGCVLHCYSAGKNLSVWQNVTVGRNPGRADDTGRDIPIIGENVNIYTGSIVAGGITIGNNVDIGAGSVVLKDIPDNSVVAGNPAKVIRTKENINNGNIG